MTKQADKVFRMIQHIKDDDCFSVEAKCEPIELTTSVMLCLTRYHKGSRRMFDFTIYTIGPRGGISRQVQRYL